MRYAQLAVVKSRIIEDAASSAWRPGAAARRLAAIADEVFGIDPRALAALRVSLGLLLLVDLFGRARNLTAHYSDLGILPRSALLERFLAAKWCICIHLISGAAEIQALLFMVAAGFAVCLLLGYRTRLATACSWYLLLSLHDRNPIILQGGDTLLRMMLFWGMFLPWGACFSVDCLRNSSGDSAPSRVVSVPGAALLLQVAFVYWFSALLKTGDPWTKDYSALYYALSLDPFVTHAGKLLLPHARLLGALTFATVWWERAGPFLAFAPARLLGPVRLFVAFAFAFFHLAMAVCLNLGLFPFICCAAWIVFLPPAFWDYIQARLPDLPQFAPEPWHAAEPIPATFNPNAMPVQAIAAFFLAYIFLWNLRTVAPARMARVLPDSVNWVAQLTRVDQVWDMFSPSPLREGGWFVMPAQLQNGAEVDVFRGGAPVTWAKPRHVADDYKDDRWRKYMVIMAEAVNSDIRIHYVRYLCHDWDSRYPLEERIRSIQVYLMMQLTLPDYQSSKPKPILLYTYSPG